MPKQIEARKKRLMVRYTEGELMALLTLASRYNPENKLSLWIPKHNARKHILELEFEITERLEHVRAQVGAETHAGD